MTPAARLRAARIAAGLTQVQAAERCDMTQGYWSELENGIKPMTGPQTLWIAHRLGWRAEDLDPTLAKPRRIAPLRKAPR